ncbi:MAG: PAS domain-containing sensor histidine kinase [Syntrophobacteraceae bacterium]|nr:PAS domain-containing sensor histidine kinase [Syntrophobacteraceae bacterium]
MESRLESDHPKEPGPSAHWNVGDICDPLIQHAPVMYFTTDASGIIRNVNPFWAETLGWDPAHAIGRAFEDFIPEGPARSAFGLAWKSLLQAGSQKDVPLELMTRAGEVLDVLWSVMAQRGLQGDVQQYLGILVNVTSMRQSEKKIREQNEFLRNVLEALPHPFYVLDAETYVIKMANSAARFGPLTPTTTCYALTHRRVSPCTEPEHTCPLAVVKQTGKPVTVEHVHYDRDGNPRDYEVHGYPIFNDRGEVVQMIEYSLDITERKQMEKAIEENAEKVKLFAYSISHDLKSPLIGIHGLVRLLCKRYESLLDDRGKSYCGQILKTSEHAVALVEEINAYIKAKEVALAFESMDPLEVLRMVREEFGALLGVRQIAWVEPQRIPTTIRADRQCMLRVFRNLVDNALKYGGETLSRIEIGYEESAEFHTFTVKDDGVGIKPEHSEKIFEQFQRNETSRGVEGTGLGLAIVKAIVEKHRGHIRLESEPGIHTTFHIAIARDL